MNQDREHKKVTGSLRRLISAQPVLTSCPCRIRDTRGPHALMRGGGDGGFRKR